MNTNQNDLHADGTGLQELWTHRSLIQIREPRDWLDPLLNVARRQAHSCCVAILTLLGLVLPLMAAAQGTAFTYQGALSDSGGPLTGIYDLTFGVFANPSGGSALGTQTSSAVVVSAGRFTVMLDFGAGIFTGQDRWLEISVHPHSGGATTTLGSRQLLTPAPYAIAAGNLTGPLPDSALSANIPRFNSGGTFTGTPNFSPSSGAPFTVGNNIKVNNLNADLLDGLDSSAFWKLAGNGGTSPGINFVGTTDNTALELKVNSSRALRLEPNPDDAPNFIAGASINRISPGTVGAAIGGGGANGAIQLLPELLFGGYVVVGPNDIHSDFSTINGGGNNVVSNNSHFCVIGGGVLNAIGTNSPEATIGGGLQNVIPTNAAFATIAGGLLNSAGGIGAFVGGGGYDGINLGGNAANGAGSCIVGGIGNLIPAWDHFSSIGGGAWNNIGGGTGGGVYSINTIGATIGGGIGNTNAGLGTTIPGGGYNVAQGYYSFAAGQNAKALHDGSFVWADYSSATPFSSTTSNEFLIRATFTGINRTSPVTGADAFAVRSPATSDYGGMYIDTAGSAGWPFYGYAQSGSARAWTYLDGSDGNKWKLWLNGNRLTVTTSGNVGIGTTIPTYQLQLSSDSAAKPNGGSWANTSDARIKKNIEPLTGALDKLTQLRGVRYDWINPVDHANQTNQQVGFLAQEVERVFPDWVTEVAGAEHDKALTPDGRIKSLSLPFAFDALIVESIRELRAEKDAKIRALEETNSMLQKQLSTLQQEAAQQRQTSAMLEARFDSLQKAVARLAEKSPPPVTSKLAQSTNGQRPF